MTFSALLHRFILLSLVLLAGNSSAQLLLNGRQTATISFKFVKNLIIIPLSIDGKGPFNFVLDTGVGVCLITDPSLRDSLQLGNLRSIKILGFGKGDELSAEVIPSIQLSLNPDITGNISAAILTDEIFDLSSYTGMPIHGLLGFDFFNSFVVRINYLVRTIKVFNPASSRIRKKGQAIALSIEGGKPFINAEIELVPGKKTEAKFIIDTGAGHPLWLESYQGKEVTIPEKNIRVNLGTGLSGEIEGYVARIAGMSLGKFHLKNILAAFPDFVDVGAKVVNSRSGNVGNSILKRFHVVFDYSQERMYLKPNYAFKEPFEHDMSGLELAYRKPDFKRLYIARVEPGSAADKIGLGADDEIESINFKPVSQISIDEITELFRSKEGRAFWLTILPKGEKTTQIVLLTLERRI